MNIELLAPPINPDDVAALDNLLGQLSPTTRQNDPTRLRSALDRVAANNGEVYVLRSDQGEIIATATLLVVETLQKRAGVIEDVVVDETSRGRGNGSRFMDFLVERARSLGLERLELTSSPSREVANILYQKKGFERRDTNCYVLKLE